MNGQWTGLYSGSNKGSITVNLDDMGGYYEGIAYLIDQNPQLPTVAAILKTPNKAKNFKFKTDIILSNNPDTHFLQSWEDVEKFYPGVTFPKEAEIDGEFSDKELKIAWKTDIGTQGSAILPKSKAGMPSEYAALDQNWEDYKKYISTLEGREHLFRGQNCASRLRTNFHRSGRADLGKFLQNDIQTLHKHLSARTRHIFNLDNSGENGAFFNLVQHHGYPTPLLDWTYSPYVAVFFAFRGISNGEANNAPEGKKVRVFIFNQKEWRKDFEQILVLNAARQYFSISEFIAINNERMIPQQAASSVTNIDDIENYIAFKEAQMKKKYLQIIDLPIKERSKIMRELSFMGITAGSLYPGLDGACEELKERFFEI